MMGTGSEKPADQTIMDRVPRLDARRWVVVGIGFALGGVFLWLALRRTDLREILGLLYGTDLVMAVPVAAALAGSYWVKAVRWAVLLRPMCRTRAAKVFPAVMVGYLGNTLLPAQLGELARVGACKGTLDLKPVTLLATIVVERIFDLLIVSAIFVVAVGGTRGFSPQVDHIGLVISTIAVVALAGAVLFLLFTSSVLRWLERLTFCLPTRFRTGLISQARLAAEGLSALRHSRLVLRILLLSGVQWGLMAASVACAMKAAGLTAPILAAGVVVAFTTAGLTLPSSPGHFGTIQLCFTLALEPFGVEPSSAVAASVLWHLVALGSVVIGGAVSWLRLPRAIIASG